MFGILPIPSERLLNSLPPHACTHVRTHRTGQRTFIKFNMGQFYETT